MAQLAMNATWVFPVHGDQARTPCVWLSLYPELSGARRGTRGFVCWSFEMAEEGSFSQS